MNDKQFYFFKQLKTMENTFNEKGWDQAFYPNLSRHVYELIQKEKNNELSKREEEQIFLIPPILFFYDRLRDLMKEYGFDQMDIELLSDTDRKIVSRKCTIIANDQRLNPNEHIHSLIDSRIPNK